jgi:hypothetical protein
MPGGITLGASEDWNHKKETPRCWHN